MAVLPPCAPCAVIPLTGRIGVPGEGGTMWQDVMWADGFIILILQSARAEMVGLLDH